MFNDINLKTIMTLIKAGHLMELNKLAEDHNNKDEDKSEKRKPVQPPPPMPQVGDSGTQRETTKEVEEAVQDAISKLPPNYKDVLDPLRFEQEQPPQFMKEPIDESKYDEVFLKQTQDWGNKTSFSIKDAERLIQELLDQGTVLLDFQTKERLIKEYIIWLNTKYVDLLSSQTLNSELSENEKQNTINNAQNIKQNISANLSALLDLLEKGFGSPTNFEKYNKMYNEYMAIVLIEVLKTKVKGRIKISPPSSAFNALRYSQEDIDMFTTKYEKRSIEEIMNQMYHWLKFKIKTNDKNENIISDELRNLLYKFNFESTIKAEQQIISIYQVLNEVQKQDVGYLARLRSRKNKLPINPPQFASDSPESLENNPMTAAVQAMQGVLDPQTETDTNIPRLKSDEQILEDLTDIIMEHNQKGLNTIPDFVALKNKLAKYSKNNLENIMVLDNIFDNLNKVVTNMFKIEKKQKIILDIIKIVKNQI